MAQLEQQARSGQPISLMDLAAAAHREDRDKKKSVVEQLKSQPKPEHKKTAPKKSAERRSDMNALTFEETNLLCIYNPRHPPGGHRGPDRDARPLAGGRDRAAGPDRQHPR